MLTIILAALAMIVSDVLSVLLTQAVARNRAVMAGVLDTIGWGAGILVTLETLDSLNGHDVPLMVGVIAAVSAANFAGTFGGTLIGKRFVREDPTTQLAVRVAQIEATLRK